MPYIPTQEQFKKVIDTLERANQMAKGNAPVNMMQGDSQFENYCGTPICHGGWYAAVHMEENHTDGADRMAKDLGFKNKRGLENWANENLEIWGNVWGEAMFTRGLAFNQPRNTGFTIQTIITHWKQVAERALNYK